MAVLIVFLVIVLGVVFALGRFRIITIFEHEQGLQYRRGKLAGTLEAGQYYHFALLTSIQKVDLRPHFESISGQEVLSSDGVSLKISLLAQYKVEDFLVATERTQSFRDALYAILQIALRDIIGSTPIDQIIEKRHEIGRQLLEKTAKDIDAIGLKLLSVSVKDIMFPGPLKQMFAKVAEARQEGLAALERARGETSALRNLANAAKLVENNPVLLQLRMLHTISGTSGNTMVMGTAGASAVPISMKTTQIKAGKPESENTL